MADEKTTKDRRGFLAGALAVGGLAVGYGVGAFEFLHYLVPLGQKPKYRELFVGPVDALKVGQSKLIHSPGGETYLMARHEKGFRVLSNICPHLGCRVHWQPEEQTFLCPCHIGIFDAEGKAVSGPPAEANQNLASLETVIRGGSVFVLIKES